jgi:hypothetical protein
MTQLDRSSKDSDLRAEIFRYSMEQASPAIREHIQRLCHRWIEYNGEYFGGELAEPFLAFEEPGHSTCYGEYSTVSAFGGSGQIQIRPSLLAGTLQHFRRGNKYREGMARFMDQVLLHEMIHQWQVEVNGTSPGEFKNYGGHGSTFSQKANAIGARLELPRSVCATRRATPARRPICPTHPSGPTTSPTSSTTWAPTCPTRQIPTSC